MTIVYAFYLNFNFFIRFFQIDEKFILKDERVFQNLSTAAEFVLGGERRNGNLWQKNQKAE